MRSPSGRACAGAAVARCLMYCVPSTLQTQASRTSSSRSRRAHAPRGTWQPPSSVLRSVRSAMIALRVSASSSFSTRVGGIGIVGAAFDADGALADGGQERVGRENFGDAMRGAEAVESGFGEHDGVVFAAFDFAEAGVDVAAEIANVEIGAKMKKLRAAAEATSADAGAFAKSGEIRAVVGDEAVADVFAPKNCGKRKAGRRFRRNVFDAVNGDVDGIVDAGLLRVL